MGKALKEYFTSMGHWGWVVTIDIIGSAIGGYLDISNTAEIPMWIWLTLLLIGLIVAPFLSFYKVRQRRDVLQKKLDAIEGALPSIEVKPVNKRDMYYLEVKNIGNTGTFEAEIQMIKSNAPIPSQVNQYTACWAIARGREARIRKSLTDRLKIAHFITSPPDYLSQHLDLYYYEPQSGQENHVHSDSYLVGAKVVSANGEERPLKKPEFVLQVTISSEPSLKEGSFIKKYKLGLSGLEELPN
jgi:hypothetical protein